MKTIVIENENGISTGYVDFDVEIGDKVNAKVMLENIGYEIIAGTVVDILE